VPDRSHRTSSGGRDREPAAKLTAALGSEHLVDLPQGSIRVYERGQGEPIVFVHGLFANAAAWRNVVALLADRYRCITADWPFGSHHRAMAAHADLTPTGIAATIADTLAAMRLENVTLVGNDGGSMLSQLVIADRPERIGRLVLTPGDAYENFPPKMFSYLCWLARVPGGMVALTQTQRIPAIRRMPFAYGWLSHTVLNRSLLDHYLIGLRDRSVRRDAAKFLRSVSSRYTLQAAQHFAGFTRPVLIAWATDDRFFPLAHARRLAADFPAARQATITNSRTYIGEDQPQQTACLIDEFISANTLTD
jgi:pimeloyl-ACP methyl ester carboxylesterase